MFLRSVKIYIVLSIIKVNCYLRPPSKLCVKDYKVCVIASKQLSVCSNRTMNTCKILKKCLIA